MGFYNKTLENTCKKVRHEPRKPLPIEIRVFYYWFSKETRPLLWFHFTGLCDGYKNTRSTFFWDDHVEEKQNPIATF